MTEPSIFETEYWKIVLSAKQVYLGRSVVLLKRNCESLSEVTAKEWDDLHSVIKRYEAGVKQAFGARMFNWCCLMNNAYQEPEPKPYVHWHVRPRYDREVSVDGVTFCDPNFGHHYNRDLDESSDGISKELRLAIIETMKTALKAVKV